MARQRNGQRQTLPDVRDADRESNETKYLREAIELIEAWQRQLQGAQSVSRSSGEHNEVVSIERQLTAPVVNVN